MLTALEIENFKGIATRQRIEFAPLTLLFGANSAGKSTVLHALLFLHELIDHGSADVDRTEFGGAVLELGGFARLVHRHETDRAIKLRVEFATPGGLERFGRDLTAFPFSDLEDQVESAWLEVTVRFVTTATFRGPIVQAVVIGVNGEPEPLVWLEVGNTLRDGEPLHARINLGHQLLAESPIAGFALQSSHAEVAEAWERIAIPQDPADATDFDDGRGRLFPAGSLPVFAVGRRRMSALPSPFEPLRVIPFGADTQEELATAQQVRTFLEMAVLGTTAQLATFLRDTQYIGPLRAIPPRGFLYERAGRTSSRADGLAAWDLLLSDRVSLVERTNAWLKRMGAGCQLVVQQLFEGGSKAEEISEGHVDKTVRRLLLDTGAGSFVLPSEVGAGVSQVVPVVVAALAGRSGLLMIEQPEIHVHPGVQVRLGDLCIHAVRSEGARRILAIETHSEHLLLRLLRRIRETAANELEEGAQPLRPDDLSIQWVEASPSGTTVRRLRVDETGEFVDRWPKGFFEERAKELF